MKKGMFVFLNILRVIAVICGAIWFFGRSEIMWTICAIVWALSMIIDTIHSIVYRRQIKWLFIVPLSYIVPAIIAGFAGLIVANMFEIVDMDMFAITIGFLASSLWNFVTDMYFYRKAVAAVKERHRYDDYYDDDYRY
ncbi:MAG: hypothetical protein ACI4SK_06745 [Christensenellales bacterium]